VIHSSVPKPDVVFYEGGYFTIVWGAAANAQCQAFEYFEGMNAGDQAKASALFLRLADQGAIYDKTKFRKETEELFAFKPQPHRFFCFFVKGRKVVIVTAYRKQGEKAPKRELKRAEAGRLSYLQRLTEEESHGEK